MTIFFKLIKCYLSDCANFYLLYSVIIMNGIVLLNEEIIHVKQYKTLKLKVQLYICLAALVH